MRCFRCKHTACCCWCIACCWFAACCWCCLRTASCGTRGAGWQVCQCWSPVSVEVGWDLPSKGRIQHTTPRACAVQLVVVVVLLLQAAVEHMHVWNLTCARQHVAATFCTTYWQPAHICLANHRLRYKSTGPLVSSCMHTRILALPANLDRLSGARCHDGLWERVIAACIL